MARESVLNGASERELAGGPPRSVQANAAITHLRRAVHEGAHWYPALLDAIGLWEEASERYRGEELHYLLGGEALDWLLLADRLTREVAEHVPRDELEALLFEGIAPVALPSSEFRERIGPLKYRCFLSYFYGVTVEEALFFAMEEEARRHVVAPKGHIDLDVVYQDIYGATEAALLAEFGAAVGNQAPASLDVQQMKAFTYFLFKRRISYCLPARVASDTKRGLAELKRQYAAARREDAFPGRPDGGQDDAESAFVSEVATA